MNARPIKQLGTLLLASALAGALATGCTRAHGETQVAGAPEVVVRTAAVESSTVSRPVLATGVLAGKEEVPLAFKIPGVIEHIDVEEGAVVRAGQRLAWLDPAEIGAAVEKAQAAADKSDRDLARAKALFADSVITRELMEAAQTGRDVAHSDLRAARFNLRTAAIVAPGDGTVLRRLAEPGQTVGAGTPIVVFAPAGRGQVVRVGVPDRDVVRLSVDDPATLAFDAHPGRSWTGRVAHIGAAAAPGTGTYDVEIRLDGPVRLADGAALASGLAADVTLTPSRGQLLRFVPVEALLEGDGERAMVWTLDGAHRPQKHDVRIAYLDGDRAAVSSGLEGVARVVTDGAPYLNAESRVREAGR